MADQAPPAKADIKDGWSALPAGMDAGRDAALIGKDQYALGINTTCRGGFPRTRPYLVARPITFASDEEKSWYETEIYQGAFGYSFIAAPNSAVTYNNQGILIASVGGRQWTIDPVTYRAVEITPSDGRNNRTRNLAYFVQAEQWLVIQDGQSAPILWDGSDARRATFDEVPVSTEMAYGQGRLWCIVGSVLMAGDIVGGPGGANAVINFTERKLLALNGDISPSFVIGNPNFLEFIPQQDTATGVGTLLVGGEHGVTSVFAELPRAQWGNGISRVVLFNIGGTGHRSPVSINGDIWWRASEGMRSYRQARAEVYTLAQLPLSTELDPFFRQDTPSLLPYVSSVYFDNRLLTTISPRTQNGRVYFQGLAALDFNVLSSFGRTISRPAWEGLWTGFNFSELKQCSGRTFAFGIDELGRNCLWEVTPDNQRLVGDRQIDGTTRRVDCQLVSGAYIGQGAGGDVSKRLNGGKFSVRQVKEEVDVTVEYKKDGEQCFQAWDSFNLCAKNTLCTLKPDLTATPCPELVANSQYRTPIILRQPDASKMIPDNAPLGAGAYGLPMTVGYEFQVRFKWTGNLQLREFILQFIPGFEKLVSGCYPPEDCVASNVCCEDLFDFTPKLPIYQIPFDPPDPKGGVLTAEQAVINFLGNGLLTPIQDVLNGIPLPTADVNNAILNLINTGVIIHPSGPIGGHIILQEI